MLKLLLCIVILFCGAVVGICLSQRLKKRLDVLLSFEKLFHRAQIQIEYSAGDLCEVFSQNFAAFEFQRNQPFDLQWASFVKRFTTLLSIEDIRMLTEFSAGLGRGDVISQKKHIALHIQLLQEHIAQAQEDIRSKSKMLRIVPLSVGMVIALIMI